MSCDDTYFVAASTRNAAGSRPVRPAAVGELRAHALEVFAHALGARDGDQLSHAMPAWRPARCASRRCEKKRSSQIVHSSTSRTLLTPAASSRSRAIAFRSIGVPARGLVPAGPSGAAPPGAARAAWTSGPTS